MNENVLDRLSAALADRYAIEGEIDRGGMAVVYLAEELKHRRKVAIKVLNPPLSATLGTERFLREIEVLAKLQHPHILTLIDSGAIDRVPYYVMPFVEGQSLKARLEREGRLSIEDAVVIACEIADALGAAHDRGVVHRDMKPGNVLLSGGHAVVADFGIAAAVDEAQVGRLTDTGISVGSPAYMSPEQATGEREVDARADIYGLGCLLYEMLAGRPPFEGSATALLTKKVLGEIVPLEEVRPETPVAIGEAVAKAMRVDPDDRFASAQAFREALLGALPRSQATPWTRRRRLASVAAATLVVVIGAILVHRTRVGGEQALWASEQLTELERLVDAGRFTDALALAGEVEAAFPDDPRLAALLPTFTFTVPIRTEPEGARVHVQDMLGPDDEWRDLGITPIEGVRFAGLALELDGTMTYRPEHPQRFQFRLDGYQERELYLTAVLGVPWRGVAGLHPVELLPEDLELADMVLLPGFTSRGIDYADFLMDRFEVTNADFTEFVEAGGYSNPELWQHEFSEEGRVLTFEQAMARFEDRTGRPGPATWSVGSFPEGTAEHPVGGVSWYEAEAYARWVGKELPTTAHWNRALLFYPENSHAIVPNSNLGTDGSRPVGRSRAMTSLGVYDLVGNVREWCYNEAGVGGRATRGAAWPDAPFHAGAIIPKAAMDRNETHGFRLVRSHDDPAALAALRQPVGATVRRDYSTESPVSDAEFAYFRRLYDYSPLPLNPVVERVDTAQHWIREHVTFDLPYGSRGGVALYLPLRAPRPLQTVVYWGGSGSMAMRSIDEEWVVGIDFMIRSGRAVAVPILAGTYGRDDPRPARTEGRSGPLGDNDASYRDIVVQWVKDTRTTIDYLGTRDDIDTDRVAYFGFSAGGGKAPLVLAVEPRIRAAVLNVGGLPMDYPLPEVDQINYAPRVTTPVLMINGEHDINYPYEQNQRPLFELLGTAAEHKRHYVSPAGHIVPLVEVIRETLDWLDRYLGVPGSRY